MHKHRTVQIIGIVIIAAALVYLVLGLIGTISLSRTGLGAGWSTGWRGWVTIPVLIATVLGFATLMAFGALLFFLAKIDTNLSLARQQMAEAAARPAAAVTPVAAVAAVVSAAPVEPPAEVTAPVVEAAAVETGVPALAAAAAAAVVAAERHEAAVEVAAPMVEVAAPAIATAAVAGVVAAEQHEAPIEVAAPAVETPVAAGVPPQVAASPEPADAPVDDDETAALRAQLATLQVQIADLDTAQSAPTGSEVGAPGRLPGTEEAARIAAEMAALKPPKP